MAFYNTVLDLAYTCHALQFKIFELLFKYSCLAEFVLDQIELNFNLCSQIHNRIVVGVTSSN